MPRNKDFSLHAGFFKNYLIYNTYAAEKILTLITRVHAIMRTAATLKKTFQHSLSEQASVAAQPFPFGLDYVHLNQMSAYLDEEESIDASAEPTANKISKTYFENIFYFVSVYIKYAYAKIAGKIQIAIESDDENEISKCENEIVALKKQFSDFYRDYRVALLQEEKRYQQMQQDALQKKLRVHHYSNNEDKLDDEQYVKTIQQTINQLAEQTVIISTQEIDKTFSDICNTKTQTTWQAVMFQQYQATYSDIATQAPAGFVEFLLQNSKKYLPEQYMSYQTAEKKFPSSNVNQRGLGHLDIGADGKRKLLAISAPLKNATEAHNATTLDAFFATLASEKIKYIVVLGENEKRIEYSKKAAELSIQTIQITVDDNHALNFDNKTLIQLLDAYEIYQQGETIAVHCDSGVGRTGQVRLLFALMDEYETNKEFQTACAAINDFALSDREELSDAQAKCLDHNLAVVLKVMSDTLCRLRKTRYCIQTEEQFTKTAEFLLLLIATQKSYAPAVMNQLRIGFGLPAEAETLKVKRNLSETSSTESLATERRSTHRDALFKWRNHPHPPTETNEKKQLNRAPSPTE